MRASPFRLLGRLGLALAAWAGLYTGLVVYVQAGWQWGGGW